MSTLREQILAAVVTSLQTTVGVSGRVFRSRAVAFSLPDTPAIIVEPVSDSAEQTTLGQLHWSLNVRVSIYVRGDVPDQLADPIVGSIHNLLLADPSLGNLAIDVQPQGTTWQVSEADMSAGVIVSDFLILYVSSLQNLQV